MRPMNNNRAANRTTFAYAIAALLGLGAALFSVLGIPIEGRGAGAVAYVNGDPIPDTEYARAREAMQAGLKRPLTSEDRKRALDILIDEELIVQEALRLDLARDDRLIRKNLTQALIRSVTTLNLTAEPTEGELMAFYKSEKSLFSLPRLVTIDALRASREGASQKFLHALQNGASFEDARATVGLERIPIPARLPVGKVGDYLGGSARDAVAEMTQDEIAGPIITGNGDLFIWLRKDESAPLSFEQARDSVEVEWSRRLDEKALETYIARLRRHARIKIAIDPEAEQ